MLAATAAEGKRPPISELLVSSDGTVLYSKAANIRRPPASIAKLMTLYLVFDALDAGTLRLDQKIKMSRHAAAQEPSRLGLAPGKSIRVRSAIQAIAVKSANDVAVALAESLAGSEAAFARRMTLKAKALGLQQTTFGNATGLPDRKTRTTAEDIARLCRAMLRNHAARYSYFGQRSFEWQNRSIANHNHLLGKVPGVDGMKTGFTASAGFGIAASAKRHGQRLIAVILGETSRQRRDERAAELLSSGFSRSGRRTTRAEFALAAPNRSKQAQARRTRTS